MQLIGAVFSAIENVLQQNGIGPPSLNGSGNQSLATGDSSVGQGSPSINGFLQQNGLTPGQFQQGLFASLQQNNGTSVDMSQIFQNSQSGQTVNLVA